jgi:hypothetical protein
MSNRNTANNFITQNNNNNNYVNRNTTNNFNTNNNNNNNTTTVNFNNNVNDNSNNVKSDDLEYKIVRRLSNPKKRVQSLNVNAPKVYTPKN